MHLHKTQLTKFTNQEALGTPPQAEMITTKAENNDVDQCCQYERLKCYCEFRSGV